MNEQNRPGAEPVAGGSERAVGEAGAVTSTTSGEPATSSPGEATNPEAPRRATRIREGAWLGGVCTGLAHHLGFPVMVLRLGFVALGAVQLIGVFVYGLLWLLLPPQQAAPEAPGLESATRTGMRSTSLSHSRSVDIGAAIAVTTLAAGMLWFIQANGWGLQQTVFWPAFFACTGVALVWRLADRPASPTATEPFWQRFRARGWFAVVQLALGVSLVLLAFLMIISTRSGLSRMPEVLAMVGVGLMAAGLLVAPWAYRARSALNRAREEKLLADARADMAAHLHDSVLQTLALIQRQSNDPKAVQKLARRQERELRTWLYGDADDDTTLAAALAGVAAEVEDDRGVEVELVTVGDIAVDERVGALVRAAREAIVNAAKHSGTSVVDVYAEVDEELVAVYVRDRGVGFDPDQIAPDRLGVRGSIIDRMQRYGGRATIRSEPGEGTDVRLEMDR